MPSPNKYHSSGFLYGTMGYERQEPTNEYVVRGYSTDPLVNMQQRHLGECQPYNIGRNADKRVRREQSKYWRSLHGRASITKGTATGRISGSEPEIQRI